MTVATTWSIIVLLLVFAVFMFIHSLRKYKQQNRAATIAGKYNIYLPQRMLMNVSKEDYEQIKTLLDKYGAYVFIENK